MKYEKVTRFKALGLSGLVAVACLYSQAGFSAVLEEIIVTAENILYLSVQVDLSVNP